ncbi:MAG: PIG-L family deacetylase [Candidatus Aenigmarchaeota archaeon]|nr:PIG-L family deacetylase [Candidatus Aenigmarchaeota archaeon]
MKILIIAPHPDDEVLGCGATIAKYTKLGHDVYTCIVTKAYTPDWSEEFIKNRPKEVEKSNKILGIKKTYFLDFPTAKLDTVPQRDINKAISDVVSEVSPNTVFIPHKGDLNRDHRLVFECALVALRPNNSKVEKILSFEVLSETDWGHPIEGFNPNLYVDVSKSFKKKIDAMKVYGTELKEYPHPRSIEAIESLAKKRGSEACLNLAESFFIIREVSK